MKFIKRVLSVIVVLLVFCSITTSALESALPGYQYNTDENAVAAPLFYTVSNTLKSGDLSLKSLSGIQEMVVDKQNNIYLLDSAEGCILKYDSNFKLISKIVPFDNNGNIDIIGAMGLFVNDNNIYIANTNHSQVLILSNTGEKIRTLEKPNSSMISDGFDYRPSKILVDSRGTVYVLATGFYNGAIMYNNMGEFLGYFGSGKVSVTAAIVADYFWKSILNETQRSTMQQSVPVEYVNFDINDENFIYTVTAKTQNNLDQIKCFNYESSNILPSLNYADYETANFFDGLPDSSFVDIKSMDNGIFTAVDSASGRVYLYSDEGYWLAGFGGNGSDKGLIQTPVAIEAINRDIFVLDSKNNRITVFSPTEYGNIYLDALMLYKQGKYEESKEYWNSILRRNGNCSMAYVGIGKALFAQEEYKQAMEFFKSGEDRENYSAAFSMYRKELMKKFIVPILIVVFIIILFVLWPRKGLGYVRREYVPTHTLPVYRQIINCVLHPYENFGYVSGSKTGIFATAVIIIVWIIVEILNWIYKAFIFNDRTVADFNLLTVLSRTVLLFGAFCISNWLISTMTGGSGKMNQIIVVSSVSIIPHILSVGVSIILSHFLTLEESFLITLVMGFGIVWSAMLLISGMQIIHEFFFMRSIALLLLTLAGLIIMAFLALLAWSLFDQIYTFATGIISEATQLLAG